MLPEESRCPHKLKTMKMGLRKLKTRLTRKKVLTEEDISCTELKRCLTTIDLIGLCIGCCLGSGLYVLTGQVARKEAGPSIIISFIIAGIASACAGVCYGEFAARIPRAGSAYVYSYVTVGEFMAFFIGWNLVLEYCIGTASVARGWSVYVDELVDYKISKFFNATMHMGIPHLSEYPDFLAFAVTMVVTAVLCFGVRESSRVNHFFAVINLLVVTYFTICGLFKADLHNWSLEPQEIPTGYGKGGFMPYGFSGMMAGSATCFYGFVGFDIIATTGEETKNPQKSIPIALVVSLLIIFLAYFCVSGVLTLMCPYYLLNVDAPLPAVFQRVGWGVAGYVMSAGAIAGLSSSILGAIFPLPRILYAMGIDGVIFKFMGRVSPRFQTPLIGTIFSGIFSGLMAMFFDLAELVDMMSIGTLLAYTLVALCVLILRFETDDNYEIMITSGTQEFKLKSLFFPDVPTPSPLTSRIVKSTIVVLCMDIMALCLVLVFAEDHLREGGYILLVIFFVTVFILCLVVIKRQPESTTHLSFKVPFLPYLPAVSCFINFYLMLMLSDRTWIRFGVWLFIGLVIYGVSCYIYPMEEDSSTTEKVNSEEKKQGTAMSYSRGIKNEESVLITPDSSQKLYF